MYMNVAAPAVYGGLCATSSAVGVGDTGCLYCSSFSDGLC